MTHSMACCKTTFKLKNSTAELDTLCRNLENFGNTLGLTKKCLFQINLALDELYGSEFEENGAGIFRASAAFSVCSKASSASRDITV